MKFPIVTVVLVSAALGVAKLAPLASILGLAERQAAA